MSNTYQRYIHDLDDGRQINVNELKDRIYKVENELERDKKALRKILKSFNAVQSSLVEQSKNEKTLSEQLATHAIALTTQSYGSNFELKYTGKDVYETLKLGVCKNSFLGV